jgi:XTP/dITP diphosphohydrolase
MKQRIVLATGNHGKLREFKALLAPHALEIVPQSDFAVPEADETGLTFVENAIIKARNASAHTGLPAIADDSGIEVDHLNGAPGIYSARYAGDGGSAANNRKLLEAMAGVPTAQRTARFQCLLVYLRHADDPTPIICQGTWEGRILEAETGGGGFGYDPLFHVTATNCGAAELDADHKNAISHRGQALRCLLGALDARGIGSPLE